MLRTDNEDIVPPKNNLNTGIIIFVIIGAIVAFLATGWLSQNYWQTLGWDFSTTGQVGDTIGGIAGPILNFVGLILIYLSFQTQIDANNAIRADFKTQKERFEKDKNFQLLNANLKEYKDATANIDYAVIKKDIASVLMDFCGEEIGSYNQSIGSCYNSDHKENGTVEIIQIKSPEIYYPTYIKSFNDAIINKSAAYRNFVYAIDQDLLLIDMIDSTDIFETEKKFLNNSFKLYLKKAGLSMHNDLAETIRASVTDYPTGCDIIQYQYIEQVVLKLESFEKLRAISVYYQKLWHNIVEITIPASSS